MPRGILFLIVLLLLIIGIGFFLSTQAEPVPQTVIETDVANAAAL